LNACPRARVGRRLREEPCRCTEFSPHTSPHGLGRGGGAGHRRAADQAPARSPRTRGWRRRCPRVGDVVGRGAGAGRVSGGVRAGNRGSGPLSGGSPSSPGRPARVGRGARVGWLSRAGQRLRSACGSRCIGRAAGAARARVLLYAASACDAGAAPDRRGSGAAGAKAAVARWDDGRGVRPVEFLGRLAVLVPRPCMNLILYHGVLGAPGGLAV
jgi:hypothetical protein